MPDSRVVLSCSHLSAIARVMPTDTRRAQDQLRLPLSCPSSSQCSRVEGVSDHGRVSGPARPCTAWWRPCDESPIHSVPRRPRMLITGPDGQAACGYRQRVRSASGAARPASPDCCSIDCSRKPCASARTHRAHPPGGDTDVAVGGTRPRKTTSTPPLGPRGLPESFAPPDAGRLSRGSSSAVSVGPGQTKLTGPVVLDG